MEVEDHPTNFTSQKGQLLRNKRTSAGVMGGDDRGSEPDTDSPA